MAAKTARMFWSLSHPACEVVSPQMAVRI